ncbi:iron chelate uptake ABC transporter family permease subunit [Streptococcus moroccensis]|uniref:Iron complex transport system permease protein n=1 Tax=Streptococcus moroccensis TaxID=1451356 RepID=A0ABT9YT51_9STRE|nr:iron chelate uptake ABC transporter family permease subunit [Streptococcus moroccensis]MDQ0223082.1 iron complex transport system permease protein [Streptococcus moroccensis]
MSNSSSSRKWITSLLVLAILVAVLYVLPFGSPLTTYALKARSQKLLAYFIIAVGVSFSTVSFQTLTGNRFLTPSILGLEAVYVLLQTILYWLSWRLVGDLFLHPILECLILIAVQSGFFFLLQPALKQLLNQGLHLILLICMALGTMIRSLSTFIQVTMDPNEFDQLQSRLFPSFQRMNVSILGLGFGLICFFALILWKKSAILDVLHLGTESATILGVEVVREERLLLWVIAMMVATITALVGPLSYLGFLVANLTYQLVKTYRHQELFVVASLLGFLILVIGQFVIERILGYRFNISMIIELIGGLLFFYLIFKEKKHL